MGGVAAPLWEQKAALRKDLLARRKALLARSEKDKALLRQMLRLPLYREARRVLLYMSLPEEADTRGLLRAALEAGKEVFAPVCAPQGTDMAFFRVTSERSLRPGRFGILEPERWEPLGMGPALCVVPGLAFDLQGRRLGYGKGYYDRFLAEHDHITAVGLCYRELLLPQLPAEEHDQRVKLVVTEDGCLACR